MTLDLLAVSDDPVTITVARDDASVMAAIRSRSTPAMRCGWIGGCRCIRSGDGTEGALFGNSTVARIERAMRELLEEAIEELRSWTAVTSSPSKRGSPDLRRGSLRAALASDPTAVELLFNATSDKPPPVMPVGSRSGSPTCSSD